MRGGATSGGRYAAATGSAVLHGEDIGVLSVGGPERLHSLGPDPPGSGSAWIRWEVRQWTLDGGAKMPERRYDSVTPKGGREAEAG